MPSVTPMNPGSAGSTETEILREGATAVRNHPGVPRNRKERGDEDEARRKVARRNGMDRAAAKPPRRERADVQMSF